MKIQIEAKVLESIVNTAAQAISSKPVTPMNECVYIEVNSMEGTPIMKAQACDSGLRICKVTDRLTAFEDGVALIPAKTLLSFLKIMQGDVTMTVDEHFKCTLKSGNKKSTITCLDDSEYNPDFSPIPDDRLVKMDGGAFENMVKSTLHCVSADQGRMVLTGVNFAFDGENGNCEGTGLDGFRLAQCKAHAETNSTFNATVPAAFSKLIANTVKDGKEVTFRFGSGTVIVEDYDTAIEASLLSGEYMDVKRLIFRESKMQVKVNTAELMQAVQMAMIPARGSGAKDLIVMNFENEDMLKVMAQSDRSEAVSAIPCEINGAMVGGENTIGGGKEIAFNGKYILEALKAVSEYAGEVTMLLNTPINPMGIVPMNRDDYYQLVLPVRRFKS